MTWCEAEALGQRVAEKKYSETSKQNFEHVYFFVCFAGEK